MVLSERRKMFKKFLSNKAYPIIFLTIIVAISVILLVVVNNITSPVVEARRMEEITGNLEKIFPGIDKYELKDEIYFIYGKDGEKLGYAFTASGSGYGGVIDILVGLNSNFEIEGVSIISQTETPGVGARITESSFTDQFKGLTINDIALKSGGGKIDAITGATISSNAVVSAIRDRMSEVLDTLESSK